MTVDLAIVIPAYKSIFLEKALGSLATQTNQNFRVYVGDDNSPSDLVSICSKFKERLDIHYYRFPDNLGGISLVQQWRRCINLTQDEKWLWLFSDDDIADPNCVEAFFNIINQGKKIFDVYRFNTRVINDKDELIGESKESPFIDTSINMAYYILHGERGNSMPDHIFSREIYNKYDFVETDFAQAADWATSIQFAMDNGICTIPDAKINWRLGAYNISGNVQYHRIGALKGHLQFLKWVINHFRARSITNSKISLSDILYATEYNLDILVKHHYKGLSIKSYFDLYDYFRLRESNMLRAFIKLNRFYFRFYKENLNFKK